VPRPDAASVPLWAPLYGATFGQAFVRFWKKYARFDGRASRSEYWWWTLAAAIVGLVLSGLVLGLGFSGATTDPETGRLVPGAGIILPAVIAIVWWLATIIPGIALTVRRLHDGNYSGWLYLLVLVPSIGGLIIFVFTLLGSNPQGARFDRPE
jgi:uncharacterized membrane protein YhaH (DUF805 family)